MTPKVCMPLNEVCGSSNESINSFLLIAKELS
jgi:hypothetical protein